MTSLLSPIDIYCERVDAGFWSEPVNAVTNFLIVAAGLYGLRQVRNRRADAFAQLLCWWVVAIGLGSFLFHTMAIELTKWADIVPIATFTLAMALFALRRFANFNWAVATLHLVLLFAAAAIAVFLTPQWLHEATNGTTAYMPAIAGFVYCGVVALIRGSRGGWYALACSALLLVGFFFRAIDQEVCEAFPLGTHFMWHGMVALMLAVNLLGVARHGAPRSAE